MFRLSTKTPPHRNEPIAAALSIYNRSFWFSYFSNTSLMVAVSLLFRYGDYVSSIGGTELELGLIVGAGAIGSISMRLVQGAGIDRHGPRAMWLASVAAVVFSLLAHLWITSADSVGAYAVRIAYHTAIAGAFGASITYVSLRAPAERMAEMIGMLGSSGFVGMAIGSQLSDLLCRAETLQRFHIDRLFVVAAAVAVFSLFCAYMATHGDVRPRATRRVPLWKLIRRYHPGTLLLMALAMGLSVGLPGTFLRPYTATLGIGEIGTFFTTYAVSAFMLRLATRRVPDRIGVRPTVLLGMAAMVFSMLLYLPVQYAWQLALAGLAAGTAHAMLFPAVVAGGSRSFPVRYRGLGVTLMLGMFDVGSLIGMPLAGTIVHLSGRAGLPAYPTMFVTIAGLLLAGSLYFALAEYPPMRSNRGRNRKRAAMQLAEPEPVQV